MAKQLRLIPGRRTTNENNILRQLSGTIAPDFNFILTRKCNLSCSHCHVDAGPGQKKQMRQATARSCFENLKPLAEKVEMDITFTGGEVLTDIPLLRQMMETAKQVLPQKTVTLSAITNGLLLLEEKTVAELMPIRSEIEFDVKMEPHYHPRHITSHDMRWIIEQLKYGKGFKILFEELRFVSHAIVAVGRAYNLPKKHIDTDYYCDNAGIEYKLDGNKISYGVPKRSEAGAFSVDMEGKLHACCWQTWVIGDLTQQQPQEIAVAMQKDKRQKAFLEMGPLGTAQVEGKLLQAVEVMREKGACGVCYALQQKLI
ncbi:MAG: radical SAM protein [Candidatus Micrarchaeota archaeon]